MNGDILSPMNEKTGQNHGFRDFANYPSSRTVRKPVATGVWENSVLLIYISIYIYIYGRLYVQGFSPARLKKGVLPLWG